VWALEHAHDQKEKEWFATRRTLVLILIFRGSEVLSSCESSAGPSVESPWYHRHQLLDYDLLALRWIGV
jgi:hypothetical protein